MKTKGEILGTQMRKRLKAVMNDRRLTTALVIVVAMLFMMVNQAAAGAFIIATRLLFSIQGIHKALYY